MTAIKFLAAAAVVLSSASFVEAKGYGFSGKQVFLGGCTKANMASKDYCILVLLENDLWHDRVHTVKIKPAGNAPVSACKFSEEKITKNLKAQGDDLNTKTKAYHKAVVDTRCNYKVSFRIDGTKSGTDAHSKSWRSCQFIGNATDSGGVDKNNNAWYKNGGKKTARKINIERTGPETQRSECQIDWTPED